MRTKWCLLGPLLILLVAGVVALGRIPGPALAQSPQQTYDLSWWTVDGGGGSFSTGAGYSLGGTAGQPDAGVLGGGGYTLGGGFWVGGAAIPYRIYLPLVLRNA